MCGGKGNCGRCAAEIHTFQNSQMNSASTVAGVGGMQPTHCTGCDRNGNHDDAHRGVQDGNAEAQEMLDLDAMKISRSSSNQCMSTSAASQQGRSITRASSQTRTTTVCDIECTTHLLCERCSTLI